MAALHFINLPSNKELETANNLTRFNPFGDVVRFDPSNGLDKLLRDSHGKSMLGDLDAGSSFRMDVAETDQSYAVKAEIPGVKKEDIKVNIERNQVSITVESKKGSEEKEGTVVVRSERYYGQLYRSFTLASDIDESKTAASYHDGILELSLPKKSGSNGKKLVVN